MPSTRKFYRTVLQIEILSQAPLGIAEAVEHEGVLQIADLHELTTNTETAEVVGVVVENEEVSAPMAATLLETSIPFGSCYFNLDKQGNDIK